ncbi:MAG: tellurite resistance TerB family protein, partial [Bacteroidales bacterium]
MGGFAKWIGGGLGWVFGGPLGGVLGFLVGSFFDESVREPGQITSVTTPGAFGISLLVLVAAVMKADKKVLKSELNYTKQFFINQFGVESTKEAMIILRDLLKQDIPLRDVCKQIARNMDYHSRIHLTHFLFGVAGSDSKFDPEEVEIISKIAEYIGISSGDYTSIKNM